MLEVLKGFRGKMQRPHRLKKVPITLTRLRTLLLTGMAANPPFKHYVYFSCVYEAAYVERPNAQAQG